MVQKHTAANEDRCLMYPHHLKLRSHCVHCHVTLILSCTQAVAAFLVQSLPRDWGCWERNGWALPSYTNFHLLSDANRPAPVLHPSSSALPVRSMRQEGKGSGTGHVPPVRPLRSPYQPFATANGSNSAEMSTPMAPPLVPKLGSMHTQSHRSNLFCIHCSRIRR